MNESEAQEYLKMVDVERLYQHVASLEGVRHPLDSPEDLTKAGEYIENYFDQIGIEVTRQYFHVKGLDTQYFNVEGLLNGEQLDPLTPKTLITSHYDTVYNSPGADDNASAIAIMLETARVLKEINCKGNIGFVSFTLEEGNPYILKRLRQLGKTHNVFDTSFRYTSHRVTRVAKQFQRLQTGKPQRFLTDADWLKFVNDVGKELNSNELAYFQEINRLFRKYPTILETGIVGSRVYVEKAMDENVKIRGVINLETIGYTASTLHSQGSPPGLTLEPFDRHKVDAAKMIGDFALIIGDDNSYPLAKSFFTAAKLGIIDLPSVNLSVPFDYTAILNNIPDILRSDHAHFWKNKIPAIMVTDTANFRNPYYHTSADTIRTLDFPFMKKVCQATIATVMSHN